MLEKMPQPIFYNESMRDKLLESLQTLMRNIENLLEPRSAGLSFLRKKVSGKLLKVRADAPTIWAKKKSTHIINFCIIYP